MRLIDKAFAEQLTKIQPNLAKLAWVLTADLHDAADLLNDTNVRALMNQGRCPEEALPWCRRIMRNRWIDVCRRRACRREVPLPDDPAPLLTPADDEDELVTPDELV